MRSIIAVFILAIILAGCSTFQSSKKINLAPFAENAVSIVSEIEYGLSKGRAIHIRPFLNGPNVQEYKKTWQKLSVFLTGIVAYSIKVVTISMSDLDENKKANMLADYLEKLAVNIFDEPDVGFEMTQTQYNNSIENIRKAETYIDAMNGAQPIVDEVSRVANRIIGELKVAQENARTEVADRIEAEHESMISFRKSLKVLKTKTFRSIDFLTKYKFGNKAVLDSLFNLDPQLQDYIQPGEKYTLEVQNKIENRLMFRLDAIKKIQEQIFPELEQYRTEMTELDNLIAIANRGIDQSKAAIVIWRQSHQTMAAGITEPAAIDLFGITKAALKTVAPIP